jgi:hypothetical protein
VFWKGSVWGGYDKGILRHVVLVFSEFATWHLSGNEECMALTNVASGDCHAIAATIYIRLSRCSLAILKFTRTHMLCVYPSLAQSSTD